MLILQRVQYWIPIVELGPVSQKTALLKTGTKSKSDTKKF